jgi:hypothetical protein
MKNPIIDHASDGTFRVQGVIAEFGVPSKNRRIYTEETRVKLSKDALVYDQLGNIEEDVPVRELGHKAIGWVEDVTRDERGLTAHLVIGGNLPGAAKVRELLAMGYTFAPRGTSSGRDEHGAYKDVHVLGFDLVPPVSISSRPASHE